MSDERRRPSGAAGGRLFALAVAALAVSAPLDAARAKEAADPDFTALSLEELMEVDVVEVTSLTLSPQSLAETAAAAFVIGEEDIRRFGATNVPELLRMVPGVNVARIDANKWAVSIRGFNGRFSSKLLVLLDGRRVYSPLYSDVSWDVLDVVLEDVERIEVIRGPGASIWGANAVNGVINIITKNAQDTQGVLLSGGGGTEERAFATGRFGGQIGDDLFYRAYAKGFKIDDGALASGDQGADATEQVRAGFRVDWSPTSADTFLLSGDAFRQDYGSTAVTDAFSVPPFFSVYDDHGKSDGGNVLARWSRDISASSRLAVQGYYDRFKKQEQGIAVASDIIDLDLQHAFVPFARNRITWGLGYRYLRTRFDNSDNVRLIPDSDSESIFSAFIQDEIALIEDEVNVTIGSKFEHNEVTGFEVQPSARLAWTPTPLQTVWGSVARAVRVPSLGERNLAIVGTVSPSPPAPFPVQIDFRGNPDLDSEKLWAFELGYRVIPAEGVSLDIAGFYNIYDNLRDTNAGAPTFDVVPFPRLTIPVRGNDDNAGESYGIEVAADWQVLPWWRLKAAYSLLDVDLEKNTRPDGGNSARHQASLRSMMDLGGGWQFDLWPRYVDNLPSLGVESYFDLDARLAWRPNETVEFAIVGQNLIDSRRKEFMPESFPLTPTQVERSVYAKITLTF